MDNRPHYHSAIYWLKQYTQQYAKVFIQLHSVIRKQTRVKLDKKHGYAQVTSQYTSHKIYLAVKTVITTPHDNLENLILDNGKGSY